MKPPGPVTGPIPLKGTLCTEKSLSVLDVPKSGQSLTAGTSTNPNVLPVSNTAGTSTQTFILYPAASLTQASVTITNSWIVFQEI